MLRIGDTFHAKSPRSTTNHLYIVISVDKPGETALFVNITTDNGKHERCCTLQKGDHPFIRRNSVVNYGDAKTASVSKIEDAISQGIFIADKPVTVPILSRIYEGALQSEAFPVKYLPFIPQK